jgi:PIN domain nuclease of toxin-antitoxin system
MIYLDTHVVVWLFAGEVERLSPKARESIEHQELRVSPMVLLELDFLWVIGRIQIAGQPILDDLASRIGLGVCTRPFGEIIAAASRQTWTRDPFDRIIVGHAAAGEAALLTRDQTIRDNYPRAVWG